MNFLRHEYFLESSREGVLKFIAELSGAQRAQRAQRSTTGKKIWLFGSVRPNDCPYELSRKR